MFILLHILYNSVINEVFKDSAFAFFAPLYVLTKYNKRYKTASDD